MSCSPSMFRAKTSGAVATVAAVPAAPVWHEAPAPEGVPVLIKETHWIYAGTLLGDRFYYTFPDNGIQTGSSFDASFIANYKWRPLDLS
jgi:hypothetical protein